MDIPTASQAYRRATAAARHAAAVVADGLRRWLGTRGGRIMLTCFVCALIVGSIWVTKTATDSSHEFDTIIDADTVTYASILLFLSFIFWLTRREIRSSLSQSTGSEMTLKEERDSLEQKVAERTQALVDAEQARVRELERIAQFGTLSQGLFHDLMSPLSSLSLYMEDMAVRQPKPEESRDIVSKAVEVSRRMRSFMDNVKQCLGNEGTKAAEETADLSNELAIARDLLMYKARMANVQMDIECADGIRVRAHPLRIQQLFLNLISNAIDACSADAVHGYQRIQKAVRVRIERLPGRIAIRISDDGCGIPADRLKDLFARPFSTKKNGTGMGLPIVRSIVEDELRGSIRVESTEGEGTVFEIEVAE